MERDEAEEICICPECPSYVNCREHVAFCLSESGQSACIQQQRGCICNGCPVHDRLDFRYGYYCLEGSERAQAGA